MRLSARLMTALFLASLALSACGQAPDVSHEYGNPGTSAAVAAPTGYPTPEKRDPAITFAVWAPDGFPPDIVTAGTSLHGVQAVGEVALGTVRVRAVKGARATGEREVSVIAVDPTPLTFEPAFARVAATLQAGDAALNANAVATRGIRPGTVLRIAGKRQALNMRVGSVVGAGSLFDRELLLPLAPAGLLGVSKTRALIVAVKPEAFTAVSEKLIHLAGDGARIRSLQDVDADRGTVLPEEDIKKYFGSFPYVRGAGDSIMPDPRWVRVAIADWKVPVIGWVRCHRNIIGQLAWAMWEIQQQGLADKIESYDGCYVARMQRLDDSVLSAHAYGIAIDLNAASNSQGDATPEIDPRVVTIMRKWGFAWGGNFRVPDGMHFEFVRFVKPKT